MSETNQPSKSESSTRSVPVYAHPIAIAPATRLPPRQPDVFVPGDDFDLWRSLMEIYLRDVPPRDHLQYIVSFLSKDAAKQFLACKLPQDAAPSEVWEKLRTLFSFHMPPAAAMEQLYERRQKSGEGVREYASALRQLAVLAFPDFTAEDLDEQILRRFITGINDPETRSKFLRKPPTTLAAAIQKALSFEAITQLQRPLEANVTLTPSDHRRSPGPSAFANRNPPRLQRGASRARCPYCRRFGSRARACGHNQRRTTQPSGADPNQRMRLTTPLHIAAKMDDLLMARYLIAHGAFPSPIDMDNHTPLDLVSRNSPLFNFLKSVQHQVPSLQSLIRLALRPWISSMTKDDIDKLPLPPSICEYLTFVRL